MRTDRKYSYEKGVNCHVAPYQPSAKLRGSFTLVFACPSQQFLSLCTPLSLWSGSHKSCWAGRSEEVGQCILNDITNGSTFLNYLSTSKRHKMVVIFISLKKLSYFKGCDYQCKRGKAIYWLMILANIPSFHTYSLLNNGK